MNLTQEPEIVTWPETHYVFIEKIGPFQNTAPQAWQTLHQVVPRIAEHNKITGYTSLYQVAPKIYRAGVSLAAPPEQLPEGLQYFTIQRRQIQPLCLDRVLFQLAPSQRSRLRNRRRETNPTSR